METRTKFKHFFPLLENFCNRYFYLTLRKMKVGHKRIYFIIFSFEQYADMFLFNYEVACEKLNK